MPHMLPMAAGQIGYPVAMFIEMIADDGLIHDRGTSGSASLSSVFIDLPFFKWQLRAFSGFEVDPLPFFVLVKTAEKDDLAVQMAKLGQCRAAIM